MKLIQLLPFGKLAPDLLEHLQASLAAEFCAPCEILEAESDPVFAVNLARQQYSSTEILASMAASRKVPPATRILGVVSVDLYIPILTFVFGEAQLEGSCAVVSTFRLRQEFYGLPPDNSRLTERLCKESVHELAHTLGLPHCQDHCCALAPSHAVEWIDLKQSSLCAECRALAQVR